MADSPATEAYRLVQERMAEQEPDNDLDKVFVLSEIYRAISLAMGQTLYIDGELIAFEDLTFKEQRRVRQMYTDELKTEDEEKFDSASPMDTWPAVVAVVKQRTNEAYTLDEALDTKPSDLVPPNGRPKRQQRKKATA